MAGKGRETRILSELKYPLARFETRQVGDEDETKEQTFVRTAELVDIGEGRTESFLFVSPTDSATVVTLGGRDFPLATTDLRGEVPHRVALPVYDVDATINTIVEEVPEYDKSLREGFGRCTRDYFPLGIDRVIDREMAPESGGNGRGTRRLLEASS